MLYNTLHYGLMDMSFVVLTDTIFILFVHYNKTWNENLQL